MQELTKEQHLKIRGDILKEAEVIKDRMVAQIKDAGRGLDPVQRMEFLDMYLLAQIADIRARMGHSEKFQEGLARAFSQLGREEAGDGIQDETSN